MLLDSPLSDYFRQSDYQKSALSRLGLKTVKDLLWYFPFRYEQFGETAAIAEAQAGQNATFLGKIISLDSEKTWKKKLNICKAQFSDGTGIISLVWFHQPYIAKMLQKDDYLAVSGKLQQNEKGLPAGRQDLYLANPVYEKINPSEVQNENRGLLAVYPETRGISSRWLRFAIKKMTKKASEEDVLLEFIPQEILARYNLPSLRNALLYIHTPKKEKDAEAARKRFSFEEIFLLQISRLQKKALYEKLPSFEIKTDKNEMKKFLEQFPFKLTGAQEKSIGHILADFQKGTPMARLLEGDVGSGKTVVAAAAACAVVENDYQVAYMAPTEVLARQLFNSFIKYFIGRHKKIGLITSSECRKFPSKTRSDESTHISKAQLLKWVLSGEVPILIGTHALIQKNVKFKNLALAIIDEQHRFGTNQRAMLIGKNAETFPHLLSMTATPIPRTLALTIYGDLDLTLLDEMPEGRKEIITEIITPAERHAAYEKINEELEEGRQAYILCPRIDPADPSTGSTDSPRASSGQAKENFLMLNMKAVKEEAKRLSREIFPNHKVGMLHGKMTPKEKEKTMSDFGDGKINILVATSVIEVGVDVPNATVIIIEGAERFGLAQLHQLRGRVRRSEYQPYCFVFTGSNSQKTRERLNALKTAKNGFELAEYDLKFRGPGALRGSKQWGVSDVGMEALKNIKMVEAAREEAQKILKEDPELKNYPLLRGGIASENFNIHFE